jgi:hypothetical protein
VPSARQDQYICSGGPIFLDGRREKPFPFEFDRENVTIHKMVVAHGAKEACERASPNNVYGSLAITYAECDSGPTHPFHIEIDKRNPIHTRTQRVRTASRTSGMS